MISSFFTAMMNVVYPEKKKDEHVSSDSAGLSIGVLINIAMPNRSPYWVEDYLYYDRAEKK